MSRCFNRCKGHCEARDCLRRIFKLIIVICCAGGFVYQAYRFMTIYWKYPTVVNVEIIYPRSVELPAVTVCSNNGINASKFCGLYPSMCAPAISYEAFCQTSLFYCDRQNPVMRTQTPAISPDLLPKMTWKSYKFLATDQHPILAYYSTKAGDVQIDTGHFRWIGVKDTTDLPNHCYVLNSLWENTTAEEVKIPKTTMLHIILQADRLENFYTATPMNFQIAVHDSRSLVNPFTDGFVVPSGHLYLVDLRLTMTDQLEAPYSTNCTDYLELWYARGGKGPLSVGQCVEECIRNATYDKNNCTDSITFDESDVFCPLDSQKTELRCLNQCPSPCSSSEYAVEMQKIFPLDLGERRALVCIVVNFRRMEMTKYTHIAKYEVIELFSVLGGYLGLWLGVSLMAVYNFLESTWGLCKRLCHNSLKGSVIGINRTYIKIFQSSKKKSRQDKRDGTLYLREWLQKNVVHSSYNYPLTPEREYLHYEPSWVPLKVDSSPTILENETPISFRTSLTRKYHRAE